MVSTDFKAALFMNLSRIEAGFIGIAGCLTKSSIFLACLSMNVRLVSCLPLGDLSNDFAKRDWSVIGRSGGDSSFLVGITVAVALFLGTLTSLAGIGVARLVPSSSLL